MDSKQDADAIKMLCVLRILNCALGVAVGGLAAAHVSILILLAVLAVLIVSELGFVVITSAGIDLLQRRADFYRNTVSDIWRARGRRLKVD